VLERDVLPALQGNVLRSHGRDHVRLLGVELGPGGPAFLRWLPVTTAQAQVEAAARFRDGSGGSDLFVTALLAATGYRRLGVPADRTPGDRAFQLGMAHAARHRLGDPAPERWQAGYGDGADLLVLLAHDDPAALDAALDELRQRARDAGLRERFLERGTVLRDDRQRPIEPFGFADGIGGPRLDVEGDARLLVLVPDPGQTACWGSYLVYRKLRQDLAAFGAARSRIGATLGIDEELAGALLVGRFRDGTPAVSCAAPSGGPVSDQFDYDADPSGHRCPLGAHARRMNPRTPEARWHQIARRGVPYDDGDGDRGLLFLCYQQDITRQFEFLHRAWGHGDGGTSDPFLAPGAQLRCARRWGDPVGGTAAVPIPPLTELRGGDYFFAPSPQTLSRWP
jgi:Dyp-type peroxidase family